MRYLHIHTYNEINKKKDYDLRQQLKYGTGHAVV